MEPPAGRASGERRGGARGRGGGGAVHESVPRVRASPRVGSQQPRTEDRGGHAGRCEWTG
jgi:hypothetical protein